MDRMFNSDSFNGLKSKSEAKSAVIYFSHNEMTFKQQLEAEGLTYEGTQKEVAAIWKAILAKCTQYGYSDHITALKRKLYNTKK